MARSAGAVGRSRRLAALAVGLALVAGPLAAVGGAATGSGAISTFAGGMGRGDKANVGQSPAAVALGTDSTGHAVTYVADTAFNVVRRIDESGHEEVWAGTGAVGYSGDGGPATAATLGLTAIDGTIDPAPGLAADGAGNLYIADTFNNVIRKVDSGGIITTIAGNGTAGFAGELVSPHDPLTELNQPSGLFLTSGTQPHLYIADSGNNRVREILFNTDQIITVAGNGTATYSGDSGAATAASLKTPTGVGLDTLGNVYIADKGNCRVRVVDHLTGTISTFAGGSTCAYVDGTAGTLTATARFRSPYGLAVTGTPATVYVADRDSAAIRKISGGGVSSVSSGSPLVWPYGVAVNAAGHVLAADPSAHDLFDIDPSGPTTTRYAGNGRIGDSGDAAPAVDAEVGAEGVATDADGNVYVADATNGVVRQISASGTNVITTVAGTGVPGYSEGDAATHTATNAQLNSPRGVAVDSNNDLYIADEANCVIRKVHAGAISTIVGKAGVCAPSTATARADVTLNHPYDVAVSSTGDLYIADTNNDVVRLVSGDEVRVIAGTVGSSGSGTGLLNTPRGVDVDAGGAVYVADTLNNRIVKVVDAGTSWASSVFAGTGTYGFSGDGGPATSAKLALPYGVSVSGDAVLVADTFNQRIRRVVSGTIATVAGSGTEGFSGDGGSPTAASLDLPFAVSSAGSVVYVADTLNHRIRRVGPTAPGAPTGVSGAPGPGQITVSWSAPAYDGGADVTDYVITLHQGDTTLVADPNSTATSATVVGLINGTPYTFSVHAKNAFGSGPESALSSAVTPRAVPGAPTGVSATAGGAGSGQVSASWTAPVDDGGAAISGYSVAVRQNGAVVKSATVAASQRSATVSGLSAGSYTVTVAASNAAGTGPASSPAGPVDLAAAPAPATATAASSSGSTSSSSTSGYWMLGETGQVFPFGSAARLGDAPVGATKAVGIAATPTGRGYWVVDAGGHVFAFGDAAGLGNVALKSGEAATTVSATPSGKGYWVFTNLGRAVPFGDAGFFGDMSGTPLNGPVLGSVPTPTGQGYFMVASDGGVFAFGDARFHGSMGGHKLNAPVESLVAAPDGGGYWLVASDGGIFAFDVPFYGSMGGAHLNKPISGMVASGTAGYLMVATDGGIFAFGTAPFYGSLGSNPPPFAIVAVTPSVG